MKKLRKILSAILLTAMVAFAAGCTPEDDPSNNGGNGGDNNGNGETPENPTEGPIHLPSVITENMDLQDLGYDVDYIVDNGCFIRDNAFVTVGPGVTIQVEGPNYWNDVYGIYVVGEAGLKMTGTASKPIRFVGHEGCADNERTWLGMTVNSKHPGNQWDYVEFHNAGVETGNHPAIWIGGSLAMRNCSVYGSNNSGVGLTSNDNEFGVFTEFKGNLIKDCDLAPLSIYGYTNVNSLSAGNTYENRNNYVYFYSHYGITHYFDEDVRFKKLEIPYYFDTKQEWRGGHDAIIEPGVEMLFGTGGLETFDVPLKAEGTEGAPIVFRPADPNGLWGGLRLCGSTEGNVIRHCVLQDGGTSSSNSGYGGTNLLYIGKNAKLTLADNLIKNCRYYGVSIEDIKTFDNVARSGNRFSNCELANVHIIYGGEYHGVTYSNSNHNMDLNDFPN